MARDGIKHSISGHTGVYFLMSAAPVGGGGCVSVLHGVPLQGIGRPGDGVEVGGVRAAPSEFPIILRCRQTPLGPYAPAQSTRW